MEKKEIVIDYRRRRGDRTDGWVGERQRKRGGLAILCWKVVVLFSDRKISTLAYHLG